jgi:hypothetical protein
MPLKELDKHHEIPKSRHQVLRASTKPQNIIPMQLRSFSVNGLRNNTKPVQAKSSLSDIHRFVVQVKLQDPPLRIFPLHFGSPFSLLNNRFLHFSMERK